MKKEKRNLKYYVNDIKSMSLWKKITLAIAIIVSGFKWTFHFENNGVDKPTYGIKRTIKF